MQQRVELVPASVWTCPECGTDQFERAIVTEVSEEEAAELRSELGVQPWVEGTFLMNPETVTCQNCGREYQTQDFQA